MNAEKTMETEEFKRCAAFHGHVCPGLSIGFRAAKAGMRYLQAMRAEDEELVAVVETDACSADAVQVLTGCTFGKGNFIYKDYGKMVGEGRRKGSAAFPGSAFQAQLRYPGNAREGTLRRPGGEAGTSRRGSD